MRNLIMSVVFFGIVAYLGLKMYERITSEHVPQEDAGSEGSVAAKASASPQAKSSARSGGAKSVAVVPVEYTYPSQIEIESADGRTLEVTLLGRSETHLQFTREGDGERFVYPVSSLTEEARELVAQYPNLGIKNVSSPVVVGNADIGDVYAEQLRVAIARVDEELAALKAKSAKSSGKTAQRTIKRQVEELQSEKAELLGKLAERE